MASAWCKSLIQTAAKDIITLFQTKVGHKVLGGEVLGGKLGYSYFYKTKNLFFEN